MTYAYRAARRFAKALADREFTVVWQQPYLNQYGVQGYCQVGALKGRMFCISQSDSGEPDTPQRLAYIFKDDHIDQKQPVLCRNREGRLALQAVAWYCSRWHKVFTPDMLQDDEFSQLMNRIRADKGTKVARFGWGEIESLKSKLH